MTQIEKNKPIPMILKGNQPQWPFADMEVGDSILVDGRAATAHKCRAYNAAKSFGRYHGKKFSGRKEGQGKVRIWRVA